MPESTPPTIHRDDYDADMAASIATLRPSTPPPPAASSPPTAMTLLEPAPYVDPTPPTPIASTPASSRAASQARHGHDGGSSPARSDFGAISDGQGDGDAGTEGDDGTEIQNIMLQFSDDGPKPTAEEVMSPRLEIASPLLGVSPNGNGKAVAAAAPVNMDTEGAASVSSPVHPMRKSSLEPHSSGQVHGLGLQQPVASSSADAAATPTAFSTPNYGDGSETASKSASRSRELSSASDDVGPPVPPKDGKEGLESPSSAEQAPSSASSQQQNTQKQPPAIFTASSSSTAPGPLSAGITPTHHRPPPPEADPEPALPFDFQRFLEQLRHRKADPIARYLKSFLNEFSKKQWMVHEQVKIISDFLAFIGNKMAMCEVWRDVSDAEFDNAREGMEKLVMNRLYSQTFSPAIPPALPASAKGRGKRGDKPAGAGRRGQHQEDVERDEIVTQKINIYSWVRLEHLDVPPVAESGQRFLKLAQDELLKIRTYRAPRDKIICVLNCCKVIFGLLKHTRSDSSADSFMPLLIYVVLHSNPDHLVSNVQYILRFRNQDKLSGEAGYYLSSLMGVIQFIESMDRTALTITDQEFEKSVEEAVSAIAEKHRLESPPLPPLPPRNTTSLSEKVTLAVVGTSALSANSGASSSSTAEQHSSSKAASHPLQDSGFVSPISPLTQAPADYESPETPEQPAPLASLFQTIQKPLSSTIGRIFGDDSSLPPPPPRPARTSTLGSLAADRAGDAPSLDLPFVESPKAHLYSAEEAAARQASAEAEQAERLHRAEHADVVDTLVGMFPDLDRDIISDVVYQKQG
ncbi:Vacuolar protein sorting-associated protein 9a, partial [Ceratocystis fimbriata CBS 114723]